MVWCWEKEHRLGCQIIHPDPGPTTAKLCVLQHIFNFSELQFSSLYSQDDNDIEPIGVLKKLSKSAWLVVSSWMSVFFPNKAHSHAFSRLILSTLCSRWNGHSHITLQMRGVRVVGLGRGCEVSACSRGSVLIKVAQVYLSQLWAFL